ncbi:glycerophosphodiester phosphodiesterase family protein [Actibacterium sp. 188UL27-1]|uniref:glycerophosphodiester phosphodiesterase family protein n=1 Tax=Actibacterium sp. 188UL27-1 TaxID=2786961 RepID=UPI001958223B|nr:glycerophosphodiester phosphodiesterase family protein [Actibacterium sp. 188UL27-1]MBM7066013.1 phosphodiesterase [Actibacterium sp. 188UL27-1]
MTLPQIFLDRPVAHRAFHDAARGRPENSIAAIKAAIDAGYGIEIDLQLSADDQAMVFHDYDLSRLTGVKGPVRQRTKRDLAAITLSGGSDGIPTLVDVLALVAGRVPLLIEIKDQDGAMGPDVGTLEQAAVTALADYAGPIALMSFNPHSVAALAELAPGLPRGLTTCAYGAADWPLLPKDARDHLRQIADFDRTGSTFISHHANDLTADRVQALKSAGVPILCWTIRSPEEEATARRIADNITFENYPA